MADYQLGQTIKRDGRTFRVCKVTKRFVRMREVFITKTRKTVSERMGDFFEMKLIKAES